MLNRLFNRRGPATLPAGQRVYAVGDVHGRADLLDELLSRIEEDDGARPAAETRVVFLGDLIDRGPGSSAVIERLSGWAPAAIRPVFLAGNHEEVLIRLLNGEAELIEDWLRFGGTECLASYGVDAAAVQRMPAKEALGAIREAIPASHVEFLRRLSDTFRIGDYLFVHAGIRPGFPLVGQAQADLRWIRQPFLSDRSDHGFVVVHGHTISDGVDECVNRIGIDTGAYRSGVLTALGLEGADRWVLQSGASPDA